MSHDAEGWYLIFQKIIEGSGMFIVKEERIPLKAVGGRDALVEARQIWRECLDRSNGQFVIRGLEYPREPTLVHEIPLSFIFL